MGCLRYIAPGVVCLCASLVFVDSSHQQLGQTFVLKAAEDVIRHYCPGQNATASALAAADLDSFLESATLRANEQIRVGQGECHRGSRNCTRQTECPNIAAIFRSFTNGSQPLTTRGFIQALPVALNSIASDNCSQVVPMESSDARHKPRPTIAQAWGYSIGFSTLIIVISNIGACLGPTMEKRFFRRILQFLVAMGAGSLTSTSLLVLIPEAFDILAFADMEQYVWKASVTVGSIYFFFCMERIMKTCLKKKRKKLKRNISIIVDEPDKNEVDDNSLAAFNKARNEPPAHSHGHSEVDHAARQTLAWMVMLGDVIHNFVDGLSIGAAFSEDVALGVSISLAVISEELPHELADIAILLHSGLTIKRALLLNFLSACFCYIGLALGVTLGSLSTEASKWIFAMAGGLFLYVPLVDMLPDMSSQVDTLLMSGNTEARVVIFLHACGLCIGAGIVIFIVNVSSYIVIH